MSAPTVTSVAEASPAARAGLAVGDELLSLNGQEPRDVIDFQQLTDADDLSVMVKRVGAALPRLVRIDKEPGEPFGVEVSSAVFDRIRTCDNHCAFCFIYQLPKGMRKSLYLKDDDYRLSFLYGNFTTLTRFTELDAERILTERLGPLFVSIHSTDPELRARMLRNPKGATSLRWLSVLLDGGIEVHGQVVVCPGVNDALALEDTLAGVLDQYPALATVGVVPLGISQYSNEPEMRAHTTEEAAFVVDTVAEWQAIYKRTLGRRLVYAADEYYLLAERPFPTARAYDEFPQHENGIGMARAFVDGFTNPTRQAPVAYATASSPPSMRRRPRATGPTACPNLTGPKPPSAPPTEWPTPGRSPCSPGPTAPGSSARSWPRTPGTTWTCRRWPTISSAAT